MPTVRPYDLIAAIKRRDPAALDEFLARHRERLSDWVRFRLGVPAGHAADHSDVVQEVSLKVWQTIDAFEGRTEVELLNWMRNYLRWWVIDLSRQRVLKTLRRDADNPSASAAWEQLPADAFSPSQCASRAELESRLRAAGHGLTNEQLAVLTLHDVDGVRLKEIARQFETCPIAVAQEYLAAASALRSAGVRLYEAAADVVPPERALSVALARLPAAERQAILLKHLENYTMEEASQALGTTPAAIGAAVYRGMRTLRTLLSPSVAGDEVPRA